MIPLLLPLFFSVSIAADPKTGNCMHLDTFHHFNASITTTIPALRFSDPDELLVQSDESWLLTQRVNRGDGPGIGPWAANRFFINTNSSKTDNPDMGICTEGLRIFDTNDAGIYIWPSTFMFSRKVMERSLEDKGDCKTMLGEACVEALKRHYVNEGRQYMEKGGCASEDDDLAGLSDVQWNRTIPEECRSLQNELEEWPWTSWGKSVLFAYGTDFESPMHI